MLIKSNGFLDLNNFIKEKRFTHGVIFDNYKIHHKETNTRYLAKISNKSICNMTKDDFILFYQESNALNQINHPSILKFYGYSPIDFSNSPHPLILTEFVQKKSLGEILQKQRKKKIIYLTNTNKLIIIYGISSAMSYLHHHNIIHRDLKPQNILLDENYQPKISNFILSIKLPESLSKIKEKFVGTPAYLAPEVILHNEFSKSSDVYSFSLILYELFTTKLPFNYYDDIFSLFANITSNEERLQLNNEIPECYKKLIEKCWSQKVEERPSFDEILYMLENDSNFITDDVNKDEYQQYIKLINDAQIDFNPTRRINQLDEIFNSQINFFKQDNIFLPISNLYETETNSKSLEFASININKFEKQEKIGHGSFGKVYKIVEKETGIPYVAKISSDEIEEYSSFLINKYYYQMDHLSYSRHPSILYFVGFSLYDFKNRKRPTLILEYAKNGSLYQILEFQRMHEKIPEWNDTKKLINCFGIASGMKFLHKANYLHSDLKSENILLDDYLYPKITDFTKFPKNSSSERSDDDIENTVGIEYYSPELITNKISFIHTKVVDVYAFAIIVYEIMTGLKPYDNFSNAAEIANEVVKNNCRPEFRDPIPDCYKKLIESCWNTNYEERPSFDEIVDILKTDPSFITENVNKEEYLSYIEFIEAEEMSSDYDYQTHKPIFIKNKTKGDTFQKVNIYQNRIKETKVRHLSLDFLPIDLSKYKIIERVNEGSFGIVYEVCDKNTNEKYAAKISKLSLDYIDDDQIINLEREITIISKLNYPSILKFIGYNSNNFNFKSKPTLITEFVSKMTLLDIINLERKNTADKNWNDTMKLINIFGIASGMSYLHSLDYIHRDLKPENILLDNYLLPKICDFGFSININEAPTESSFKGTPAYSAPEVFYNKYSKAGDVYSFALIVYEIITHQYLFSALNRYQVMYQITNGYRPDFKFPIPHSYQKLIEDCWCKEPEQRPSFNEIVYRLKNDQGFLTENIDKDDYFNYINYIEEFNSHNVLLCSNSKKENNINHRFHKVSIDINKETKDEKSLNNENFLDLNKYEKCNFIKKGDIYKYYKIKSKETGEIYYGKISRIIINKFLRDDLINLSREVNIISKINHPSFMKFIGYSPIDFKKQNKPVIVTELPLNGSLEDILESERKGETIENWNETKKLINIYGIASAMSYLHSNNIIHRDLKPSNILLDDFLFPKIGDFGLSMRYHDISSMTFQSISGMKGTPKYSSPEILQFNEYTKSSDVYSFALIVFEIVTNEIPFKEIKNSNEIFNEVVLKSNRPKIKDNVIESYKNLIEKCWSQNPDERPTFKDIIHILRTDLSFITDKVNKEDYYKYIEFIEKSQLTFDCSKQILQIDNFIHSKSKIIEDEKEDTENNDDNELKLILEKYIELNQPKNLIEILNEKFNYESISSVFDICSSKYPSFYTKLCKEGIKLNNAVAHHNFAVSIIFNPINKSQKNFTEAREHLLKAIEGGFTKSYFMLGRLLHEVFQDNQSAFKIAMEGNLKGDNYSKCLLGYFISHGIGTIKDHKKGVYLMLESGVVDYFERFSTDIGIYYFNLANEKIPYLKATDKDKEQLNEYKKAFKWFEKAFNMNKTKATINNYGLCFLFGIGISKNLEKAKEIFSIGVQKK